MKRSSRFRIRWQLSSAGIIWVLLPMVIIPQATSQICEPLGGGDSTFDQLNYALRYNTDLELCPGFKIKGNKNCGSGTGLELEFLEDIEIRCADSPSYPGGGGCVVDCPGRHFTVPAGSSLSLRGFKMRGAHKSSIRVSGGTIDVKGSIFEENKKLWNRSGEGGGAIFADAGSVISISGSTFKANTSPTGGGAIHFQGDAEVLESTFISNSATEGGAIKADSSSSVRLERNNFERNRALSGGAAANISSSKSGNSIAANRGCGNSSTGAPFCSGIYQENDSQCLRLNSMNCSPRTAELEKNGQSEEQRNSQQTKNVQQPACGNKIVGSGICPQQCCSYDGRCTSDLSTCPSPHPRASSGNTPCGGGKVGNGICPKVCCSEWGWCGVGYQYCKGTRNLRKQRNS